VGDPQADRRTKGRQNLIAQVFFLTHALEHGAVHRTEITVTLTHLGIAHPDLDGWMYSAAAGYGREVSG
jgi:uncharacterized damage-inducible protein DinB